MGEQLMEKELLNKDIIKKSVGYLLVNFSINLGYDKNDAEQKLNTYCALLHSRLSKYNVTEEMFTHAVGVFVDRTEGSNFNKLPSVGDFLSILDLKPKTLEQIATEQAQECISNADRMRWQHFVQYDDPVTNWVLQNSFGGVSVFCWSLASDNEKKTDTVWVKKRFVEEYMTAHSGNKKILHPIVNTSATFIGYDKVLKIGCEETCDKNTALSIENKKKREKVQSLIAKEVDNTQG